MAKNYQYGVIKKPRQRGQHWGQAGNQNGFTLIEALIAMTVFSIGILAVITMQTSSVNGNAKARYITEAVNYASDRMETLLGTDYTTITDTAGTNAGVAGLNDGGINAATTADGSAVSTDGNYNIYWNVADNTPASKSKTIRVIVTNKLLNAPVTITFVRADGM